MNARTAIQTRLLLTVFIALPLIWLFAASLAAYSLYDEVEELNDTQMSQLARRLLTVPEPDHDDDGSKHTPSLPYLLKDDAHGEADDHNMAFAVWDKHGKLLLADRGSRFLHFTPRQNGFHRINLPERDFEISAQDTAAQNTYANKHRDKCREKYSENQQEACLNHYRAKYLKKHAPDTMRKHNGQWRVLYLSTPDGKTSVAVGQNMKVRYEMVWETITAQAIPWAAALPALLLLLLFAVRRALNPLNQLADQLSVRAVNDDTALEDAVPREMQPLVASLNRLFCRIHETIERENRFTADAAHELRSPLAALKVQAEVLSLSEDEDEKNRTLINIRNGIDRAGRLIEQLLIMARLDPMTRTTGNPISWQEISDKVLQDANRAAREKHIRLRRNILSGSLNEVLPLSGDAVLIELMLRNLVDNAVRYTPEGGEVTLEMSHTAVCVSDNGTGIAPDLLPRVRERFFRPPGQSEAGSGLGLSIVERVAQLHSLQFTLENRTEGGLRATISRR